MIIDCHFHPNITFSINKKKKIKKIYQEFFQYGFDGCIVTEHVYKKPKEAWEYMKKFKPKGFYIIPGLEYLTKEGIDIIIFAKKERYKKHPVLLNPKALGYMDLFDYIDKNEELFMILPHPYIISKTGIARHVSHDILVELADKYKKVEYHNACFEHLLYGLNKLKLYKLWPSIVSRLSVTSNCSSEFSMCHDIIPFSGSDAHHIESIGVGTHFVGANRKGCYESCFDALISHQYRELYYAKKNLTGRYITKSVIKDMLTIIAEGLLKKTSLYKIYM